MKRCRRWTKEEETILLDEYGKYSLEALSKRLDRTPSAICHRLKKIEGTCSSSVISGNMKVADVVEIMGVGTNTVYVWIKKKQIPYIKHKSNHLILDNIFWNWLKNNLNKVNFKNIDDSVEFIVPEWYRNEIKKHKQNFTKLGKGTQNPWTPYEETFAWSMFFKGYTYTEIAEKLERTLESVSCKLRYMKRKKLKKAS